MARNDKENVAAEQDGKGNVHLAAVCGTYCGACPAYIAKHGEDDEIRTKRRELLLSSPANASKRIPEPSWVDGIRCDGCLSGGEIPEHCQDCSMKLCVAEKQDIDRCSDCEELPCYRIADMINTGLLHRAEYPANLAKIRDMGVEEWVKHEEERWRCPHCRLPLSWYDARCPRCGEARSDCLFPLTED